MGQPLVSVIMPTYNQAQFIGDAINSVLRQTYSNIELIIIDNHSQDNTEQVVKSFTDARVRYFKFSNKGIIAASRNLGARNAQGRYTAFLDSDDIWFPDKLDTQLKYLRENPDVYLVCCSLKIKSPDERYDNRTTFANSKARAGYMHNQLLDFNFISCSTVVVKTSVFNNIGYFDEDPEVASVEDWNLWLKMAREYKIAFIPRALGVYRMHNSNYTMGVSRLEKALYVISKHSEKGWLTQKQTGRAKAGLYFHEGWLLIDKDIKKARRLLWGALCTSGGNPKAYAFSALGLFLSLLPFLCNFIKRKSLDKKIGGRMLNLQNL